MSTLDVFHLGFTGTRDGMTARQKEVVARVVRTYPANLRLHHGDCVGADEQMHRVVWANSPFARFHGHPPRNPRFRAYCKFDHLEEPKPYLARDRDIVDACELLIATPKSYAEVIRSGTWATVRYAAKVGRRTLVVFPDGRNEYRGGEAS